MKVRKFLEGKNKVEAYEVCNTKIKATLLTPVHMDEQSYPHFTKPAGKLIAYIAYTPSNLLVIKSKDAENISNWNSVSVRLAKAYVGYNKYARMLFDYGLRAPDVCLLEEGEQIPSEMLERLLPVSRFDLTAASALDHAEWLASEALESDYQKETSMSAVASISIEPAPDGITVGIKWGNEDNDEYTKKHLPFGSFMKKEELNRLQEVKVKYYDVDFSSEGETHTEPTVPTGDSDDESENISEPEPNAETSE